MQLGHSHGSQAVRPMEIPFVDLHIPEAHGRPAMLRRQDSHGGHGVDTTGPRRLTPKSNSRIWQVTSSWIETGRAASRESHSPRAFQCHRCVGRECALCGAIDHGAVGHPLCR
jgi:hypothetical protein